MALGLKKEFEKQGHQTIIQLYPEWENGDDSKCDAVIVMRGLKPYNPKDHHINILWNISHPDILKPREINRYDHACIASYKWIKHIKDKASIPVEAMLQCTDPEIFKPFADRNYYNELLFIGNGRGKSPRKIIRDLLPTNHDLAVYGEFWTRYIDPKYVKGKYITNQDLYKFYGSCGILLNDHWGDMRKKGFINNRIFDGLATEAFIISDAVEGLSEIFSDSIVEYHTREELHQLIDYYIKHPELRREKARKGAQIVRSAHTYAHRVGQFIQIIDGIAKEKRK